MRAILLGAILALAGAGAGTAIAAPESGHSVCLDTTQIVNTTEPDDRTILFHMNDGTVWANHLKSRCSGIRFYGFIYAPSPPHEVCANQQSIRVIRAGSVCQLGDFEKLHNDHDAGHR